MQSFQYYNNKLYFVETDFDDSTGFFIYKLTECELDGSNRNVVYEFPVLTEKSSGLSLTFHKGYIYHTLGEKGLKRIDMRTWEEEQFNDSLDKAFNCKIYFIEDSTYVVAESYEEDGKQYENVLLEINASDNSVKILLENTTIWTMSDKVIIGYEATKDSLSLYTMTWNNFERNHFMDDLKIDKLFLNDKHIVVTTYGSSPVVYLYDLQGELLDVYVEEVGKKIVECQGFIGDSILIQSEEGVSFILLIENQRFADPSVIELNSEI